VGSQDKFQPSPSAFIGREPELAELQAGLDDAIAGRGRLFLISGEPGIGKTRITNELATGASDRGARVIWGRCWEGHGAPAYWPWIQVVRSCVGDPASERLGVLLNSDAGEVIELLPEIAQRRRSSPVVARMRALPSSDPEQARFRLFDSAARLLKNLAATGPLMIVVDDLHDADQPSLLMLRFVARELRDARILVVGTYRDTEVRRSPALAKLMGDLGREGISLPLAGLSKAEVAQFVMGRAGTLPSSELISKLHRTTAGNPFFLDGIVRLLLAQQKLQDGAPSGFGNLQIPDGVRDAIRRRLTALPQETHELLSIASVIGQEFDVDCLQRVSGGDPDSLLDSLDQAQRDGVIVEARAPRARRRFCHDLIRETLYDDLPTASRLKLHWRIAQVLEELYAGNPEPHLAELAHHYRKAAQSVDTPSGEITKAIDYSIKAGEAVRAVAYEESASHWEAALELMEQQPHSDERRANLCLQLGALMTFIDRVKGIEYQEKALKLYENLSQSGTREVWLKLPRLPYGFSSLPMVMAQVHTNLGAYLATPGPWLNVQRSFEHLHKAEAMLGEEAQSDAGARLSSQIDFGLALAASRVMRNGEGLAASLRAMKTAENLREVWLIATSASQYGLHLFCAGRLAEGFAMMDRAWEKADSFNEPTTACGVTWTSGSCHFALGDLEEARRCFERELSKPRNKNTGFSRRMLSGLLGQVLLSAGKMNQARPLLAQMSDIADYGNGQIAFWEGRWEESELVWAQDLERAHQGGAREEGNSRMLCWVRRILKQHSSAEALLQAGLSICGEEPLQCVEMCARPQLALLHAETDRCEEAVPHLARCREIMAAGEDWRGVRGEVMRAEALVSAIQKRFEEAQARFEKAVEIFRHYQVPLEESETLYYWGRALVAAGKRADGAEKLDAAADIYWRCGAGQPWIERALAAKPHRPGASVSTVPEPAAVDFAFRRQGDYWTLSFKGQLVRLKDAKGLHYIAHLLRHPWMKFNVIELANLTGAKGADAVALAQPRSSQSGTDTATAMRSDLGDAGAVLDPKAKADYRRRLGELKEELEEAERLNDLGRKERLREEFDFVTAELAAAIGLGGRDRKTASHVERARSMVSNRIRFSMSRIEAMDSALGRHLNESIRTGYLCAYLPRQPVDWQF
jgi:tetratricopeptide (TPR) repeat protein